MSVYLVKKNCDGTLADSIVIAIIQSVQNLMEFHITKLPRNQARTHISKLDNLI